MVALDGTEIPVHGACRSRERLEMNKLIDHRTPLLVELRGSLIRSGDPQAETETEQVF